MGYRIARHSCLGVEWYAPLPDREYYLNWTSSITQTHIFEFKLRSEAVRALRTLIPLEQQREIPQALFIAEFKEKRWKFTPIREGWE